MSDDNYYKEATGAYAAGDDFIAQTELPGVLLIGRPQFPDERGFFQENFRKADIDKHAEGNFQFVQSNHSRSKQHTLRGIHIAPWHKLISVIHGQVQAVVVDMRPDAETFGKHLSVTLGEGNHQSLFVPAGFGNAYLVLSETADYMYLVTDYWAPGKEKTVAYNDEDLKIEWQSNEPFVSSKDAAAPTLRQTFPEKFQ